MAGFSVNFYNLEMPLRTLRLLKRNSMGTSTRLQEHCMNKLGRLQKIFDNSVYCKPFPYEIRLLLL